MCQAFDELMEDMKEEGLREGKIEGIKEGIKEGRREGLKEGGQQERISIVRQMLKEGMERSLIIRVSRCSDEELAMAAE